MDAQGLHETQRVDGQGGALSHHAPESPVTTAFSDRDLQRISQFQLIGRCEVPLGEIDRIIEAYVKHGVSPRHMRRMGITTLSEYYINKCLVNAGVIKTGRLRPREGGAAAPWLTLEQRVQRLEEMMRRLAGLCSSARHGAARVPRASKTAS